jgi:2-dehydro-3-deoxyphosphogluconate aldolase/(4S)-4-hydroxy-2-oxoglutarate aldolase
VKAIKGPQPWTSIMPTGGVSPTEESLKAWFEAGVTCVGMGSKLIAKDTSGHYNFKEIEKMIKFSIDTIKSYK